MRFYIILMTIIFTACSSSKNMVHSFVDDDGNLVGIVKKSDFQQAPFQVWFEGEYTSYQTDDDVLKQLKPLLKDVKIKAVMGTWCSDSRREVPHFYKILDELDFNYKNLTTIAVDRSKKTPTNDTGDLMITRVPTFIFYQDGKEINRIVEYPIHSLEQDMFQILSDNNYKHAYFE